MSDQSRKWMVGCGTGCASGCGCFVLTSLLLLLGAYLLWETGGYRERWLKGDQALIWAPLAGLVVGALFGLVMTFAGARFASRRRR